MDNTAEAPDSQDPETEEQGQSKSEQLLEKTQALSTLKENFKKATEKQCCEFAVDLVRFLKGQEKYDSDDSLNCLKIISAMYHNARDHRCKIGESLHTEGLTVQCLKMLKFFNGLGIFSNDNVWFPTYYTMNVLWNYSDAVPSIAKALADDGLVKLFLANLSHQPYLDNLESKNVNYVVKASLSICHNVARTPETRYIFKENKGLEIVKPFTNSDNDFFKALSMLTMAYIVDEDDNDQLESSSGTGAINFIVKCLTTALQNEKSRRYRGFTPEELAQGLGKLAVNDVNKNIIFEAGAVSQFVTMMESASTEEQAAAAQAVWTLAFDKDVRDKIREVPNCVSQLETLSKSENKDVKRSALGALWVIKEDSQTRPKQTADSSTQSHIMISYNWSHKVIARQINERLKASGHKTWIDVEQMGGSTLEAMAEAVEKASIILICMSEKYKESPNCRTEAEYTFQLRKKMIPLKLQRNYQPNGWLGFMIGTKLFFDFSGKYPFESKYTELVAQIEKELGHNTSDQVAVDVVDTAAVAPITGSLPPSQHSVRHVNLNVSASKWDRDRVARWLEENGLQAQIGVFEKYDGRLLGRLACLRAEAPDYFYKSLKGEYNLDMLSVLKFVDGLDEIFPLTD